MKKIDAHAHIGDFGSWAGFKIGAEEMIEEMAKYNIEKSIVSYRDNSVIQKALQKYPDKLSGLAWLEPVHGKEALEDGEKLLEQPGFEGIKLHPLFGAYPANDPVVHPFMELARHKKVPVFIHSGHPPFSLPWSIAQLAEDFPDVKIVMVHMGHGHGIYIQAAIDMAMKFDNLWLENSGMPMHTKTREAYKRVGSDRIFWGSDLPFHHYSVEILRTEVSGLNKDELENVFYNNIKKFMGWS